MGRTKGATEGRASKQKKAEKKRKAEQAMQAAEKSARARFMSNFGGASAAPAAASSSTVLPTALPPCSAAAQLAALNQQRDALIAQQAAQAQANMDAAVEHAQEQQALPLVVDDDGDGKEEDNSDSPMVNYLSLVNARLMVEMKHGSGCTDMWMRKLLEQTTRPPPSPTRFRPSWATAGTCSTAQRSPCTTRPRRHTLTP